MRKPETVGTSRKPSGGGSRRKASRRIQNPLASHRGFDILPSLDVREVAMIQEIERVESEHGPVAVLHLEILGEPHVDPGNLGDVQAADWLEGHAAPQTRTGVSVHPAGVR